MRRIVVAGGAAAVVVVAAGGALAWNRDGSQAQGAQAPLGTAVVTRGDLVDTEKVDGKLTYDGVRDVWTGASGVVTWAPEQGATVERGETLLSVAGKPVTLMYGGMTVDGEFTGATEAAVEEWQDDRGLDETGVVDAGQVVFLSGAVRVREVKAPEGKRAVQGQPVLTVAGTKRVVHVDLDADKQDLARKGAGVTVELPGGETVKGKISKVGGVAETTGSGQDQKTTVGVDISLGNARTGRLDEAPVSVELESERREGVLSVPVEALLALREGGFGVEVADASRRLLPVRVGVFGGGRVEVSGSGLREGMKVGVPAE